MGGTTAAFAKVQKREQLHAILPSPPQSKAALNAGKLLNVSIEGCSCIFTKIKHFWLGY
jgi:hypothetical protein